MPINNCWTMQLLYLFSCPTIFNSKAIEIKRTFKKMPPTGLLKYVSFTKNLTIREKLKLLFESLHKNG